MARNWKETLMNLVTEEVPSTDGQQPAPASAPIIQVATPSSDAEQAPQHQGHLNEDLLAQLSGVLEKRNIEGPDYIELKKSATSEGMVNTIQDEGARLAAAYYGLCAIYPQKMSKSVVLNSIDTYVSILEGERKNAMGELDQIWQDTVVEPGKQISSLQAEMQELNKRLSEITSQISSVTAKIEAAKVSHANKKSDFEFTFNAFVGKLKADREKLAAILPE